MLSFAQQKRVSAYGFAGECLACFCFEPLWAVYEPLPMPLQLHVRLTIGLRLIGAFLLRSELRSSCFVRNTLFQSPRSRLITNKAS